MVELMDPCGNERGTNEAIDGACRRFGAAREMSPALPHMTGKGGKTWTAFLYAALLFSGFPYTLNCALCASLVFSLTDCVID